MNNKIKFALMAGAALGLFLVVTSLIGSVVPFAGCCNCLWPIVGGLLATMLYVKQAPTPASIGDGAMVGGITGVVGGLINLVIGLPLTYLIVGVAAMDMQMRQYSPDFPLTGIVLLIISGIIGFIIFVVLATIGGIIGIPLFEKRKGNAAAPPPPQPPQDFNAGPGGSYGAGL